MTSTKRCTVCKLLKSLDQFYNYKKSKDGKQYRCKQCDNEARMAWLRKNPERAHRSRRSNQLKFKYGISLEEFEELFRQQGECCAICGTKENHTRGSSRYGWNFAVDHCHETGRVRGVLCSQCNRAIGLLGDTVEGLMKAVKYLEVH